MAASVYEGSAVTFLTFKQLLVVIIIVSVQSDALLASHIERTATR